MNKSIYLLIGFINSSIPMYLANWTAYQFLTYGVLFAIFMAVGNEK